MDNRRLLVLTAVRRNDPCKPDSWERFNGCAAKRPHQRTSQGLLSALHLDGLYGGGGGLGIQVTSTDLDRFQIVVEVVHQRDAGGNVQAHHRFITHLVQMLDDGAQRVAMGSDQGHPLRAQVRHNLVVPVR